MTQPYSTPFAGQSAARLPALRGIAAAAVAACALLGGSASATEGGGNSYAIGVETNYPGLMFGEGAHLLLYYTHYESTHSKDNAGNDRSNLAYFKSEVNTLAARVSYVWPGVQWLGANVETRAALPLPTIDLRLGIARPSPLTPLDRSGSKTGVGDLQLAPLLLGWHAGSLHQTAGVEGFIPIGEYNASNNVNIGRNYYQIAPVYAATYLTPATQLSAKLRFAVNGKNRDTHYRSGNEFTLEFSGGYQVSDKLQLGLNGYLYRQTTDDKQNGLSVNGNGNRGSVNALGPYLQYAFTPKFSVIAKLQSEFDARNRAQGSKLWLQTKVPF